MSDELSELAQGHLLRIQQLQRENIPLQAWAILTSTERYVALFVDHRERSHQVMRLMMDMPVRGLIADSTPAGVEVEARDAVTAIRVGIAHALGASLLALALSLGVAYALGFVSLDLPVHRGKWLQTGGAFLAVWGTLLAVRGPDGVSNSIPVRAHALIYTVILTLGAAIAMIGTLVGD